MFKNYAPKSAPISLQKTTTQLSPQFGGTVNPNPKNQKPFKKPKP